MASNTHAVLWLRPISDPDGVSYRLEGDGPYHVGRNPGNELRLTDKLVSRRHAALILREGRWYLTDADSRHGTFVNSRRLRAERPTPVEPGDMIRFGPCTFRLVLEMEPAKKFKEKDAALAPTTEVRELPEEDLGSLAYQRLALLMDGAAEIDRAASEPAISEAAVRLALEGSGYGRAVMLRAEARHGRFEVLATLDRRRSETPSFEVSLSLVKTAGNGKVAHLSTGAVTTESMGRLGIHSAICVPVLLDGEVVSHIYLDSREGEEPPRKDAAGFCAAIARLCSHRFADLRRRHLEQLEEDLCAARRVQECLSPGGEATIGNIHFASRIEPGRYVAGDWFDLFEIGEGRVAVCFGDVCGHELGAAIIMSSVLAYLRAVIPAHCDPAAAARQVNRYVGRISETGRFVTLLVGIFDPEENVLEYVDAGHGHWMIKRKGKPLEYPEQDPSVVVGIQPFKSYGVRREWFAPGDRLILYSDGLVEPRDPDGEMFGSERLAAALEGSESPADDVERAFVALRKFVRGRALADDTSMASLEILAAP